MILQIKLQTGASGSHALGAFLFDAMQIEIYDWAYKPSNSKNDFLWVEFAHNANPGTIDIPAVDIGHYIANLEHGLFDPDKLLVTIPESNPGYFCHQRGEWVERPGKAYTYTVKDWIGEFCDEGLLRDFLHAENISAVPAQSF